MPAKNGGRGHGADGPIETSLDGLSFLWSRHDSENLFRFENLIHGHGDGVPGDNVNIGEPSFADLLLAAGLIEIHDNVGLFGAEIGWRIVEGQVTVFTDSDEGDIDRGSADGSIGAADYFDRILLAIQKMTRDDAGFRDEAILQELAETGGMRFGQADVFVEMEDRKSTRLNSSHSGESRMPSSA